uniref:YHS domain-containing protein n=1 Tax=Schlesneria paludicola TaxID=360056 RepID=A0A7C2JWE7_9PLAN
MFTRVLSLSVAALMVTAFVVAAEAEKFSAKCLVAGKPDAKEDKNAEYKGAKVFFCCDNCKAKFTGEPAKFAVAANHQLVVTKQFKQTKCPISGAKINPDESTEVAGVKVSFCCENCKGKVASAKGDEQKELVFKDAAFDKAFEIVKK